MIMKIVKIVWIGIALFVLFVTLYGFDGKPNSDIGVFFAWAILFLSFPMGLILPLIYVVLYDLLSISTSTTYLSIMIDWTVVFMVGYFQWFKLLPFLIEKWRGRHSHTSPT